MSDKQDLLVELGTEELPPKALKRLSDAFASGIKTGLEKAALNFSEVKPYASPRRLAVVVEALDVKQASKDVARRGPALTAAFGDDGCPTQAAEGFARSCGVSVEALDRLETDKGAWLVFNSTAQGCQTGELIPDIVSNALRKLPIPKRMRWSDLSAEFVRPVHWLVLLFGDDIIKTEILNVQAGRETRGHRFHFPGNMFLADPASYVPLLQTEGHVLVDYENRREAIRAQVLEAAASVNGQAVIDDDLLDEVTGMVEWPVAFVGKFDKEFLQVPSEAIVSAMEGHQKYFPVVDKHAELMPCFIAVSNIESHDPEQVRIGNERVIRPRLSDAVFFWEQDKKQSLSNRVDALKDIVFQQKLGSLFDKSKRIAGLAMTMATDLNADKQMTERAAILAKCDLVTEMVGEFPDLQGIMGRYYAQHDKEPDEVATAIYEHYMPRFAGDELPETPVGQAVAIADKLDTLVGIFGIGQIPTGDKDPFGLRRSALGIMRILIEKQLYVDLIRLINEAVKLYGDKIKNKNLSDNIYDFMMERLRTYYLDRDIPVDVFEAVYALRPAQPYDFDRRMQAVDEFRKLPEAHSLAAANKRISNIILKQADGKMPDKIDSALLKENIERTLAGRVNRLNKAVTPLFAKQDYKAAMEMLADLKEPVDEFFDQVMVMVDDKELRNNRLAMLNKLRNLFLQIADLSRLQDKK